MSSTPSESGGVVLAVDDVARNLQLLGTMLTASRYEVLFATSGQAALDRVAARKPDLILLDLMMPEMDGMEVCRRLKSDPEALDIPIIFVTAAGDSATAARALESGAVDYITKPFNSGELLARVRTHVTLKRTRDELVRIIGQKNELLSALAHDLKNPISSMRFAAMTLREQGLNGDDPRGEMVESIVETGDKALEFIQQELARNAATADFGALQIEPVDPLEMVSEAVQENLPSAHRKGIELEVDVGEGVQAVLADADALGRALKNLVSNAIKFSSTDTKVMVRLDGGSNRHVVRFRIRDQGPGLSDEDKKHLFKPYQRLSARPTAGESSTGLGLSITRDLVKRLNGEIGCDSVPGQGAEFWIELKTAE